MENSNVVATVDKSWRVDEPLDAWNKYIYGFVVVQLETESAITSGSASNQPASTSTGSIESTVLLVLYLDSYKTIVFVIITIIIGETIEP